MKKNKFKNFMENLSVRLKFFLLFMVMSVGFFAIYWTIWMLIGLPIVGWSCILLSCLALLSDYGYYRWLDE